MKTRVGILFGGMSGEHEVSIKSAFSILSNIDYDKYEVKPIFIDKQNVWFEQGSLISPPTTESQIMVTHQEPLNPLLLKDKVDVVFPIAHGPFGEDGKLQAILEFAGVPYVGCDVLSSAIGMDKAIMKDVFSTNNIPQGQYVYFHKHAYNNSKENVLLKIEQTLGYPCFIKPSNLGSSVGINKATNRTELITALEVAFSFDSKVVVEEFIKARELEIGVLGNEEYVFSAIGEIKTSSEFYDYEAKYISTNQNEIIIPAKIPNNIEDAIHYLALQVARTINVKGLSRIDFFYVEDQNKVYINEINTLPGFTKFSMYPQLFNEIGYSYKDLISELIELGLNNEQHNSFKQTNLISNSKTN